MVGFSIRFIMEMSILGLFSQRIPNISWKSFHRISNLSSNQMVIYDVGQLQKWTHGGSYNWIALSLAASDPLRCSAPTATALEPV